MSLSKLSIKNFFKITKPCNLFNQSANYCLAFKSDNSKKFTLITLKGLNFTKSKAFNMKYTALFFFASASLLSLIQFNELDKKKINNLLYKSLLSFYYSNTLYAKEEELKEVNIEYYQLLHFK